MVNSRPTIACLGAGRMGRGIAVAFAYAGHTVTMIDVKPRSAEQFAKLEADALEEVRKTLASLSRFGLMDGSAIEPLIACCQHSKALRRSRKPAWCLKACPKSSS
jgi:3-hydroxybutyryl-CoA dehydrogenase